MAENSKIEWTHHTFNPWRGCARISEGCRNCYAEALSKRNPGTLGAWGPQGTRVVSSEPAWKEPLKWDRKAKEAGVRQRVFCASLADVFEDWQGRMIDSNGCELWERSKNSFGWELDDGTPGWAYDRRPIMMQDVRHRLFRLIEATPHLDWLLLTKRPENCLKMWPCVGFPDAGVPGTLGRRLEFQNVWLGTSVENQAAADERIPHLLRVPARVRFLSCEPLLEEVNLGPWLGPWTCDGEAGVGRHDGKNGPTSFCGSICRDFGSPRGPVDWVIVGGESGDGSRPMHPFWARSLRDQCQATKVPFFFKQWGEWVSAGSNSGKTLEETSGREAYRFSDGIIVNRIGKVAAGRLLDSREWNEVPE